MDVYAFHVTRDLVLRSAARFGDRNACVHPSNKYIDRDVSESLKLTIAQTDVVILPMSEDLLERASSLNSVNTFC